MLRRLVTTLTIFTFSVFCKAAVNVGEMQPGEVRIESWDGAPVVVHKRSEKSIKELNNLGSVSTNLPLLEHILQYTARRSGNEYASALLKGTLPLESEATRSIRPDVLVVMGISSTFGCAVDYLPERELFIDPCSKAEYRADGRIVQSNAQEFYHLLVPPHYYDKDNLILGYAPGDERKIVDFTPDIEPLSISNGEKLLVALEWKKFNLVKELLRDKTVVNYRTSTGASALHVAASKASPDIIELMIERGFRINIFTEDGMTPIQIALLFNNDEIAVTLLKHGAKTSSFCSLWQCTTDSAILLSNMKPEVSLTESKAYIESLKAKAL
ncbi:ankyrin repeat domain-containing protein [Photobacterium alginatilyticum]|uniref:Ankyrin repeat domain-containing protein n=1 Tax=Photobacterium alginatilyticum TaxID=1775171 RepID=A0ABW9YII5_9GAMM|nr:ankyrin repeat domain-containing protein [Photobacterium alginatilyticum]NBI53215.1 hypothetical protein [Photobacterium alginatilyticum]